MIGSPTSYQMIGSPTSDHSFMRQKIRNFVIIAHIDHGKSTLADRFLELTGTVEKRKMREQFLDMHPLEREKGITIKMAPVRMVWQGYILNLIDTPGHVDFSYEVSRALACVEGAILLVDATQGIQAQTLANLELAKREHLVIIPAINKIDLPSADIDRTEAELKEVLGGVRVFKISAKTGEGVEELLGAVAEEVPMPEVRFKSLNASEERPLRALIFDSVYDSYLGVVAHVRIFDGELRRGERLRFLATAAEAKAEGIGIFTPERTASEMLGIGEIGYIATGIKEPEKVRVGDTITRVKDLDKMKSKPEPLPGYKEPVPLVYASIFPENQDEFEALYEALKKLKLNDASFFFELQEGGGWGRGFRAGFLGMLHMEIVAERIRREYGLKVIFTNPSTALKVKLRHGKTEVIFSATKLPEFYETIEEPWVEVEVITPPQFLWEVTALINERQGKILETATLGTERILVKFEASLREIIIDFYDRLKSISKGFASMVYTPSGFRPADLVRLDILVAGEKIPVFSEMVPREKAYTVGRERVKKLKEMLPRELFVVSLQACSQGRILARETLPALRKDVTGYLYGGDRTRKMKLWKKQERGKKKLKSLGRVRIPSEVFWKMMGSR